MRAKHRLTLGILRTLKLIKTTLAKELVAVSTFNWFIDSSGNTDAAYELFYKVNINQELFDLIRLSFKFALLSKLVKGTFKMIHL